MSAKNDHGLERMTFFSDAVIAIMLTLLAIELPVPEVDSPAALWHGLAEHSDEYTAFLISFCVIAATWVAHHMLFIHVRRADPALVTLNLLSLLAYVLIPWASKTLGEVDNGAGVIVYSAAMTFLGLTMLLVARQAVRAKLIDPEAPRGVINGIRAWAAMTTAMFAVSIPLALILGRHTMWVWPVGYVGLRLAAEFYTRRARRKGAAE
ncbi:TMEM175 family protein [Actinorhabdospora filicis]|uniref:TMEM175 family protein n=1 Tax=Actinorhabdospora filicis TaxID=1785913 RepID=UPI002556573A|nr:TMEM175 family protein [Actinorhabdospora filicis]